MFELVKTTTNDKLTLSGLFARGKKERPVVIHVHGFEGDFYTNSFILPIAKRLQAEYVGFLSVQTRGTDNESFFKTTDNKWVTYGSHHELIEEAYLDIDAWIGFLAKQGFEKVVLQGHSMGTMKNVRYIFEGNYIDKVKKLVLLAPFDILQLAQNATKGKWKQYLEDAKKKVVEGEGEKIIPEHFLDVSMSYKTYVSHHQESDFTSMFAFHNKGYDFPILNKLNLPVSVLAGGDDEFFHPANPKHPQEAMEILNKNIKNCTTSLIDGSGHGFEGYENQVANEVAKFVERK